MRLSSRLFIALFAAVIFIGLPASVHALSVITQETITIDEDEIIDENLFAAGNSITINGTVNGDVYAFANDVTITGTVGGDVISGAAQIDISGDVAGNVRAGATTLRIGGHVGKNITAAATTLTLAETAAIDWSAILAGQTVRIDAPISGNITAAGESVSINNTVGNKVDVTLGENGQLSLGKQAEIAGDLTYRGTKTADVNTAAVVLGDTIHKQFDANLTVDKNFITRGWILLKLIGLFGALLVGTVLVSIAGPWIRQRMQGFQAQPGIAMLWGLLFLIVTPIAVVLLAFTLIGAPLSLIILIGYLLALYLTKVGVGIMLGELILNRTRKDKPIPMIWTMMLGTFIYVILVNIPTVGWLVALVGTVWFLGALAQYCMHHKRHA